MCSVTLIDAVRSAVDDSIEATAFAVSTLAAPGGRASSAARAARRAASERRLDDLAHRVGQSPTIPELVRFLGMSGLMQPPEGAFHDPRNSCLHQVIATGSGLPLSAALIAGFVGVRVGRPVDVIGFPGHVLMGGDGAFYDPFGDGTPLDGGDLQAHLKRLDHDLELDPRMLRPLDTIGVAARMTANLRAAHLQAGDLAGAFAALDVRHSLTGDPMTLRELAALASRLGRYDRAAACHELLAEIDPARAADHRHRAEVARRHRN